MSSTKHVARLQAGQRVVVIGAGPAGLTAAYLLSKAGISTTVLEADDVVGGIARTVRYGEFRFDIGGHRFFTKLEPVQALWKEILGEDFLVVRRLSRIYYEGRFFNYPIRAGNALRGLGPRRAFAIVLSYLQSRQHPHPVEENFEQWVTNRFGRRLYETFFKTYTEKVWGIPCTEIRAEWAAQRIQGLSLGRAILTSTALTKRSPAIKTLLHHFHYPRLGPGQVWESCQDRITATGNRVLLRHRVRQTPMAQGRVTGVEADTPDGPRWFPADHVISTMPLPALVRSFTPEAPPIARDAARQLRYRDFILVALILGRPSPFPDNWVYVHTPGVQVGRIQNFNNWSPDLVPVPGKTCLGMEYFCFKDDALWASPDADLKALAARELEELGLARAADVEDGTVIRMPKAYPIYDSGYREHLAHVRACIDPIPNLQTVGRNGMHKYNNQDHSMLTAMMAVWNMQGASHDIWAVNTDTEYHEEQRTRVPAYSSNGTEG